MKNFFLLRTEAENKRCHGNTSSVQCDIVCHYQQVQRWEYCLRVNHNVAVAARYVSLLCTCTSITGWLIVMLASGSLSQLR